MFRNAFPFHCGIIIAPPHVTLRISPQDILTKLIRNNNTKQIQQKNINCIKNNSLTPNPRYDQTFKAEISTKRHQKKKKTQIRYRSITHPVKKMKRINRTDNKKIRKSQHKTN